MFFGVKYVPIFSRLIDIILRSCSYEMDMSVCQSACTLGYVTFDSVFCIEVYYKILHLVGANFVGCGEGVGVVGAYLFGHGVRDIFSAGDS